MAGALIALIWTTAVVWLIARAARQYAVYQVLRPQPIPSQAPAVDVIVPARNEADAIARCLAGLAAQDYPPDRLGITVVDDGSTDATAAIARRFAAGDRRFSVIESGALPSGWTGKTHACWRGAEQARNTWLCFMDADTIPRPALLRSAIAFAIRRGIDLLSLEPQQELVTPGERLIIPTGLCALGCAGDLRRTADPRRAAAPANGQFMLLRRAAYDRAGGHRAVCGAVAEDSALARRVKATGGRIALLGGAPLIAARMYRSLPQLWEGIAKNVTETFGGARRTAVVAALGVALAWASFALPAVLAASLLPSGSLLAMAAVAMASLASLAVIGMHIAAARYFAIPLRYGLLFPLGYTLAAMVAASGIIARRQGRVTWKGRVYPTALRH